MCPLYNPLIAWKCIPVAFCAQSSLFPFYEVMVTSPCFILSGWTNTLTHASSYQTIELLCLWPAPCWERHCLMQTSHGALGASNKSVPCRGSLGARLWQHHWFLGQLGGSWVRIVCHADPELLVSEDLVSFYNSWIFNIQKWCLFAVMHHPAVTCTIHHTADMVIFCKTLSRDRLPAFMMWLMVRENHYLHSSLMDRPISMPGVIF